MNRTLIAQGITQTIKKLGHMKLSFFTTKNTIFQVMGQSIKWEEIFTTYISDWKLMYLIYNIKKTKNTTENGAWN